MKRPLLFGALPLGAFLALASATHRQTTFVALDQGAEPLKTTFNADRGMVRLLMYVSPTCGECLRGAKQMQETVLARLSNTKIKAYVVWAPKNGGRQEDVGRVTPLVTDARAAQYWDAHGVVAHAYDAMLGLTGPCAGIFIIYRPETRWEDVAPPKPDYQEDAHAHEFNRPYPQFDALRFAARVQTYLD